MDRCGEEELFYPAMKRKMDQDGKDLLAEAVEEHHVVTILMDELKGLDPKDKRYHAKFKVLMEQVEHHIEEEEGEMFPEAEEVLGERLDRLGTQMEERRQHLTAARHPQATLRGKGRSPQRDTWRGCCRTLPS